MGDESEFEYELGRKGICLILHLTCPQSFPPPMGKAGAEAERAFCLLRYYRQRGGAGAFSRCR
jgi:hypothetical protein